MDPQSLREALKHVRHPVTGKDLVSMGAVKETTVVDGVARVTLDAPKLKPEDRERFEKVVREAILLVSEEITSVVLTLNEFEGVPKDGVVFAPGVPENLRQVGSIIAVSSCKGGVGKSTIAAALACELVHRGRTVGILDTDIHGPSLPTLFNLHDVNVLAGSDQKILPVEMSGLKLMSFGFLMGNAPAIMRGPMIARYLQELLFGIHWGKLDYLLIDMPPGTGDVALTLTQSIKLNGALIVTTRQSLAVADVERGIAMFSKVNVPVLGLIENMAAFVCDGCGKTHAIFGDSPSADLQTRLGVATLAQVPIDKALGGDFLKYHRIEAIAQLADIL